MHSRNWSSRQMLHLPERETYDACVHFQMFPHATHEAPIGQQPVCRRTLYGCAPQHTPGVVCEKATLQSFLKQQLSQPTEASCRGACDSGAAVSRDSVLASTMVTMLIAIFWHRNGQGRSLSRIFAQDTRVKVDTSGQNSSER